MIWKSKTTTEDDNLFSLLSYKKKSCLYYTQFFIGVFMLLHIYVFFKSDLSLPWFALFMFIDSGMYFLITFLESYDDYCIVYKTGVYLGLLWGIVSFIISLVVSINTKIKECLFFTFYTWIISLISIILIKDVIYYSICCNSHHSNHHSIFFHFLSLFKFSFNNHYLI